MSKVAIGNVRAASAGSLAGASKLRELAAKRAPAPVVAPFVPVTTSVATTEPAVATAEPAVVTTPEPAAVVPIKIMARPATATPAPAPVVKSTLSEVVPTTLTELLTETQRLAAKEDHNNDDIIEWVYSICHGYDIRVRHDQVNLEDGAAPSEPLTRGVPVCRLVLSTTKTVQKTVPLQYECNGVVIDPRTWRVLAMPPGAFNLRPIAKTVNMFLAADLYDIIRVDDGTVVTIYQWLHPTNGPTWAMASSNGYDVSSLCWIGDLTYAEVFRDLARRAYPAFCAASGLNLRHYDDGDDCLEFDKLDPTRCYTIGFRHHNFHPMLADPERMWLIQVTDVSGKFPRVLPISVPTTLVSTTSDAPTTLVPTSDAPLTPDPAAVSLLPGIPNQTICSATAGLSGSSGTAVKLENLRALGENSIAVAAKYIAGHDDSAAGSPLPAEIHYGFILRSRNPTQTGVHSDILVETPLLACIRKRVYERAPSNVRDALTSADRLEYNALRSFLTANERQEFIALYPGWQPKFHAYNEFVNNVVKQIVHSLRQRSMGQASRAPHLRSETSKVAAVLLEHICAHEKIAAFHKDTERIVRDYVVNPEYAFRFLRAMRAQG